MSRLALLAAEEAVGLILVPRDGHFNPVKLGGVNVFGGEQAVVGRSSMKRIKPGNKRSFKIRRIWFINYYYWAGRPWRPAPPLHVRVEQSLGLCLGLGLWGRLLVPKGGMKRIKPGNKRPFKIRRRWFINYYHWASC